MATYVLLPGAGSDSWYWHLVAPELRARGHEVLAVDLPVDDDSAGFEEYADGVVDAIGDRGAGRDGQLVLVAQSLSGFVAPLVAARVPVDLLVLVAAMVPAPGESAGEWWANTGHEEARREQALLDGRPVDGAPGAGDFDPMETFFHDVSPEVVEAALAHGERKQSGTPFVKPWPLTGWPDVPTRFLLGRNDRLFPAAFQRRVVRERLGIVPDEMESGHLPALAHPMELVERLEAYREGLGAGGA
ncbi:MAG: hydrolase, alpha/beta fold family protein [Actinomycetia bacterium]|nr:hydrolase, alpha/beta fold family protein [Actinomycetes bacterium]